MLHSDRGYSIKPVSSVEELAGLLVHHVWSSATGFDLNGMMFVNTSSSPDALQEYAVSLSGRRVESITIGGSDASGMVTLINSVIADVASIRP